MVGTIRKNKTELSIEFTKAQSSGTLKYDFYQHITLVYHLPKKSKNVLLWIMMIQG